MTATNITYIFSVVVLLFFLTKEPAQSSNTIATKRLHLPTNRPHFTKPKERSGQFAVYNSTGRKRQVTEAVKTHSV